MHRGEEKTNGKQTNSSELTASYLKTSKLSNRCRHAEQTKAFSHWTKLKVHASQTMKNDFRQRTTQKMILRCPSNVINAFRKKKKQLHKTN